MKRFVPKTSNIKCIKYRLLSFSFKTNQNKPPETKFGYENIIFIKFESILHTGNFEETL